MTRPESCSTPSVSSNLVSAPNVDTRRTLTGIENACLGPAEVFGFGRRSVGRCPFECFHRPVTVSGYDRVRFGTKDSGKFTDPDRVVPLHLRWIDRYLGESTTDGSASQAIRPTSHTFGSVRNKYQLGPRSRNRAAPLRSLVVRRNRHRHPRAALRV